MSSLAPKLFTFFFVLQILSGLFLFITFGFHGLFDTYVITPSVDAGIDLINQSNTNGSYVSPAITELENLKTGFESFYGYYDTLFLIFILTGFVQSVIAAANVNKENIISFFGLITIGNVFLIYLVSYAIQVRDWIVNEIVLNTVSGYNNVSWYNMFSEYTYYILVLWYLALLLANQIDWKGVVRGIRGSNNEEAFIER